VKPGTHDYASYEPMLELEADVCIIGSGAGGSATACAIAERGLSVVVLEEGRSWAPRDFKASATWAFRNLYAGRGTRATQGNCVIPLPGGRGVGGSTLINSAICFRTPKDVLHTWRETHGCHTLDDAWMDSCFDRIWRTIGVTINPPEVQKDNNRIFKKGAEALGLKGDWFARSAPGCVGCGTCQQGCQSGGKWSADRTFLAEALGHGNVGVYADCRVEGVETAGGAVTAVTGRTLEPGQDAPAGNFRVRAREFVLSGGPIGSPRFLLRNGLAGGPVGHHLRLHPTTYALGRFPFEIVPWRGVTQGYYVDGRDKGYLLQTFSMPPDQYYVSIPIGGDASLEVMRDLRFYGSAGALVHDDDSVGRVTEGALYYSLGEIDRHHLLAGVRQAARVFFAAGATSVIGGVHGKPIIHSEAEIDAVLADDTPPHEIGLYASHPMGTCRMGSDRDTSVVDPQGRVWGWKNLHVADASVFPTSLGVNPQVTVMAMGLTIGRSVGG